MDTTYKTKRCSILLLTRFKQIPDIFCFALWCLIFLLFKLFKQNLNRQQHLCVYQVAKLSTGDSLDMTEQDESTIVANDATVKDMEVFITCLESIDQLL